MSVDTANERRQAKRRPILKTFSIFVVVPKKGIHRLQLNDLSEAGVGFDLDTEGEVYADFPIKIGDSIELQLFLNQSLYLPLVVEVARLTDRGEIRNVGAIFGESFKEKNSKHYQALCSFLKMLDNISGVLEIKS